MKKSKKILALILSLIMMMSAASLGLVGSAVSSKSTYTGTALGSLNSADQYELSDEQNISMILDYADKMLGELNLMKTTIAVSSIKVDIDLTSLNGVNKTLIGLNEKLGSLSSFIGDLADLKLTMFTANTYRDGTGARDVAMIQAFLSFLSNSTNAGMIKKLVQKGLGTGSGQLNPGSIVSGFLPANVTDITNDIVGFLKETLFKDRNAKFDTEIPNLIMDMINNLGVEALKDFKVTTSSTIYSLIDSAARSLINWVIEQVKLGADGVFGADIKSLILTALPTFEQDYPFVDLDGIKNISWNWSAQGMGSAFSTSNTSSWLAYQVNDFVGMLVNNVLPEFKGSWTADHSTNSLATLDSNIAKLAKYVNEKVNPTSILDSNTTYSTKTYAMVLANFVIKMFLPALSVSEQDIIDGNVCKLAVQALNELMCYYLPEKALSDLYLTNGDGTYKLDADGNMQLSSKYTETYCKTAYKSMIAEVAAQFLSGYFPIKFTNTSSFDTVLKDAGAYFVNDVAAGALGTVGSSETIYTAFDRLILSVNSSGSYIEGASSSGGRNTSGIMPQNFLPSAYNTTKKVVDQLFTSIENLSLGGIIKLLVPNTATADMNTALLPNVLTLTVIRVVNKLFPGTWTQKTTSLDALITNANLGTILYSIMTNFSYSNHICPVVKLLNAMLGLSSSQKKGEADVSLAKATTSADGATVYVSAEPVIYSSSTTLPSGYFLKIENTSSGINSGYSSADGTNYQDSLYQLRVNSVVCENSSTVKVSGLTSTNAIIDSGASIGLALSGTCPLNTTLQFLVTYQMSNENGRSYGDVQQSRIYVYYGSRTTTTLTSNTVSVTVPTKIYASPNTLARTLGSSRTSNLESGYSATAETSTMPTALTNAGYKITPSSVGKPASTTDEYFNLFSVSYKMTTEQLKAISGNYTIKYEIQTKDTAAEGSAYGTAKSTNIALTLFYDNGLTALVDKYLNLDLQSGEFSSQAQFNAFMSELRTAYAMVYNPGSTATTVSALESAFAAECSKLETAYNKLLLYQVSDAVANLKQRITEYSTGTEDAVAKYRIYDYTPVSWKRYSSTMSTIKRYFNTGVTSSLKINEALRINDVMANRLVLRSKVSGDSSKNSAFNNLKAVYNTYSNILSNSSDVTYTTKSKEALQTAIAKAADIIAVPDTYKASDFSDARSAILAGVHELTVQPLDVQTLEQTIDESTTTYNDNAPYTDEAWEKFLAAVGDATDIVENPFNYINSATDSAEIAKGNEKVDELKSALDAAVEQLKANPFISELVTKTNESERNYGFVYDDSVKTIHAGKYKIQNDGYIIVPFGTKGNDLKNMNYFTLTSNESKYFNDEGEPLKEGDTPMKYQTPYTAAACINPSTGRAVTTAAVRAGNLYQITWENGQTSSYNVIMANNPADTASATSKTKFVAAMNVVGQKLPQVLKGELADSEATASTILACDVNGDGKVDNTDLVLYKMYKQGKWNPVTVNFNL